MHDSYAKEIKEHQKQIQHYKQLAKDSKTSNIQVKHLTKEKINLTNQLQSAEKEIDKLKVTIKQLKDNTAPHINNPRTSNRFQKSQSNYAMPGSSLSPLVGTARGPHSVASVPTSGLSSSTSHVPMTSQQRSYASNLFSYLTGSGNSAPSTTSEVPPQSDYDTMSVMSMDVAEVARMQKATIQRKRQAMLQYEVSGIAKMVKILVADATPEKVAGMLPGTVVYALFMALRYADHMNNEIMVKQLLSNSMQQVKRALRKHGEDVTMSSFWLSNIHKTICLFKQYSGELEFSERNTAEQNEHSLVNFDLCEFRTVYSDMGVSAYQRLIQASSKKLRPLIVPAMLEQDTIQNSRKSVVGDDDDSNATALEQLLNQMTRWNVMFHKHGMDHSLIRQFFNQVFYLIVSTTLNTQLVRKDMCNWSKAMQIRFNTSQLEDWLR